MHGFNFYSYSLKISGLQFLKFGLLIINSKTTNGSLGFYKVVTSKKTKLLAARVALFTTSEWWHVFTLININNSRTRSVVNCTFYSERLHVMQHRLTNAVYQTEVFCICQTKVSRNGHMKQQFE